MISEEQLLKHGFTKGFYPNEFYFPYPVDKFVLTVYKDFAAINLYCSDNVSSIKICKSFAQVNNFYYGISDKFLYS